MKTTRHIKLIATVTVLGILGGPATPRPVSGEVRTVTIATGTAGGTYLEMGLEFSGSNPGEMACGRLMGRPRRLDAAVHENGNHFSTKVHGQVLSHLFVNQKSC